jgi:SAM-dependent methyltransferase
MPEHVRCNLCGSDDVKPLYSLRDYRFRVDDRLWNVVECRRCGLGYVDPRPTPDEIGMYYPAAYHGRRGSMTKRYERQAAYVQGTGGNLLDIGAARGDFLAHMRALNWNVVGIEPAEAENAHDLPVLRQRFPEECDLPEASFDVITAWAVFEHLHDPASAFEKCRQLLRPGGRLVVQVPNLRSVNSRYARLEDVPRHLYFFSPKTLRVFAQRSGLALRKIHHTTNLYGGSSGRGVLRLALVRATGGTTDDFFALYRSSRRERFKRGLALGTAWTAVGAFERAVLSDWLVRVCRISGQIVAIMARPENGDR